MKTPEWASDPTAPVDLFAGQYRNAAQFEQITPWRVVSSALVGGVRRYTLRLQRPDNSNQSLIDDERLLEVQAYPADTSLPAIAAGTKVWGRQRGDGDVPTWEFLPWSAVLTTANVDGTQESTTTRLEFDQSTGVRVDKGATDADPDVVSIDLTPVMTKSLNVLTQGCLTITLTKTYSTNPGETHLLTDVSLSYSLVFKQRSITLLGVTEVGTERCVAAETECCTPAEDPVTVCAGLAGEAAVSRTLKVVVSGGPTFFITYDSGAVWWQGYVNAFDCTDGFGLTLTPNCDGTWDIQAVASFRGPAGATVTPTSTSPFLLTVTGATESGLCGGTVTFTVEEV